MPAAISVEHKDPDPHACSGVVPHNLFLTTIIRNGRWNTLLH